MVMTLQPIVDCDGASEKIFAQKDAIISLGIEAHIVYLKYEDCFCLYVDDTLVGKMDNSTIIFNTIYKYIIDEKFTTLYIRYNGFAGYKFHKFLKVVHSAGIKIYMEIPTYPYDGEVRYFSVKSLYRVYSERIFRNLFYRYVDRIVTFSLFDSIFSIPTIKISNAPARILPVRKEPPKNGIINLITVANIAFWHGYDRLLKGLYNYYKDKCQSVVNIYIIGKGNSDVYHQLVNMTKQLNLSEHVFFEGAKNSCDLDCYFDMAHLAIGCLGCHRKGIKEVKSLKNIEYAMRGIPFVYSESNSDFDDKPYVLRVPADESDIDVQQLIEFANSVNMSAQEISESVRNYTWENQMRKVFGS